MNIKNFKKNSNINLFLKIVSIVTVFFLALEFAGFGSSYDNIRNNVLRLHIVANSDSAEDQNLKLQVRDAVLAQTQNLFEQCSSEEEAVEVARNNCEALRQIALETVEKNGYSYDVSATVCDMWFEDRVYSDFTLPAGNYEAVRITLGKAQGHNWWCVMFPAVCLPAAKEKKDLNSVLSGKETDMCEQSNRYEVRFKIVEVFQKCRFWLKEKL